MAVTTSPAPLFAEPTTSAQRETEAPTPGGASVHSPPAPDLPPPWFADGACVGSRLDFTPDTEISPVPAEIRRVCADCPIRARCQQWATDTGAPGYWAGTTSTARLRPTETAGHAPGQGSLYRYRQGCRCEECRFANARARATERARARARARLLVDDGWVPTDAPWDRVIDPPPVPDPDTLAGMDDTALAQFVRAHIVLRSQDRAGRAAWDQAWDHIATTPALTDRVTVILQDFGTRAQSALDQGLDPATGKRARKFESACQSMLRRISRDDTGLPLAWAGPRTAQLGSPARQVAAFLVQAIARHRTRRHLARPADHGLWRALDVVGLDPRHPGQFPGPGHLPDPDPQHTPLGWAPTPATGRFSRAERILLDLLVDAIAEHRRTLRTSGDEDDQDLWDTLTDLDLDPDLPRPPPTGPT